MTAGNPIFIGGCPRSGLSLLGGVLDSHREISCGPDAGLLGLVLASRDFAATFGELHEEHFHLPPESVRANFAKAISSILDARRKRDGKTRIAEKSALNAIVFKDLARLFPEARFIHCVRDGRDVVASLLQQQWRDPRTGNIFAHCSDPAAAARYWSALTAIGLDAEQVLGKRVQRVAYEDLAAKPKVTLKRLFDFLGVEAGKNFEPMHDGSVGRWRRDLSAMQLRAVESVAGPMLKRLGY